MSDKTKLKLVIYYIRDQYGHLVSCNGKGLPFWELVSVEPGKEQEVVARLKKAGKEQIKWP